MALLKSTKRMMTTMMLMTMKMMALVLMMIAMQPMGHRLKNQRRSQHDLANAYHCREPHE
jgi:hypothetical protein